MKPECSVDGCSKKACVLGFCANHYNQHYYALNKDKVEEYRKKGTFQALTVVMERAKYSEETRKALLAGGELLDTRLKQLRVERW